MFRLADAAKFLTERAPVSFLRFIGIVRRIFNFKEERANRLARFRLIVADYKAEIRVADIAEKYECSPQTVLRYARLVGLDKRPKSPEPDRRGKIIAMYRARRPIAEIAMKCKCSPALISKIATEEGINRKKDYRRK